MSETTDKSNKSLEEVTVGEISEVFNEIMKDGLLFRCNFNQISQHFLSRFLKVNPFSVDFITLKEAYLTNIGFQEKQKSDDLHNIFIKKSEDIEDKNEREFHKYICKTYFGLIKEPKEELLSAFINASRDIKEIDETLKNIQEKLDTISKNNINSEIQEKKTILNYYQRHNIKAKDEILEFIKNDINDFALMNSYDNSMFSGLLDKIPYNYRWNPKWYKPKYPNDLENKFRESVIADFQKLLRMYQDDKSSFYEYLQNYIRDEEIVFSIKDLIDKHHLLDVRKEIILEAVSTYEHGAKIMFANVVPTIIEGILHDLCLIVGENENELQHKGFQAKLDKLQDVFGYELYYEYFSFRFRLFRNKVAHGQLTKDDVDELGDLLLLDLYEIFKLVLSLKLKFNQKRFVIDILNKTLFEPDYKYVLEYLLLDQIDIPSFYKLDKHIAEVEKIILSNEFWEFLEREVDLGGEAGKHGVYTILKKISNRNTNEHRCKKIFKKIGIKVVDNKLASHYFKYLTKDY